MKRLAVVVLMLAAAGCAMPEGTPAGDSKTPMIDPAPASARPRPTPAGKPAGAKVTRVIDGVTVELVTRQRVRLIGVEGPRRGTCRYRAARDHLRQLIGSHPVTLVAVPRRANRDASGRLLRYLMVAGKDAGHSLIEAGHVTPTRGSHPKGSAYTAAAADAEPSACTTPPGPTTKPRKPPSSQAPVDGFANCAEARASGVPLPLRAGDPGWNPDLDRDDDGEACEPR